MLPPYRNQSIDLHVKSIDWFLHEGNTGTQWVKHVINVGRHVDFHKGRFQYLLTGHSFSRLLRTHTVAQPEPSQTSKMENFATIINDYSPLTVVAKFFILDVCVGPCYVSEIISYFTSGYLHTLLQTKFSDVWLTFMLLTFYIYILFGIYGNYAFLIKKRTCLFRRQIFWSLF